MDQVNPKREDLATQTGNGGPWTGAPHPVGGLLSDKRDDVGAEVVDGVLGDGGPHEGVVVGLVVADLEPEAFEERPQDVVGGVEEVDVDDGKLVEQFDGDCLGCFGRFEGGERVELGLSLCFELAEPVAGPTSATPLGRLRANRANSAM